MKKEVAKIILGIGDRGGLGNVMEVLGYTSSDFQKGFDLANELQNEDYVKMLYSNFNQNNIVVEFTLVGEKAYRSLMNK